MSKPKTCGRLSLVQASIADVKEDYQRDIFGAGIFGSVSRNRARVNSDVDILIVMKEGHTGEPIDLREKLAEVCGRENIHNVCMARTEIGLGAMSVLKPYFQAADIEHFRHRDAMTILDDGLTTLGLTVEALKGLQVMIAAMEIHEWSTPIYGLPHAFIQELTRDIGYSTNPH